MYLSEITWYNMNPTMHKVLTHAAEYVSRLPPTIASGMLSEEASESCNKDIKRWQITHSRQFDPVARNLDVFCRLMDRSDPLVANFFSSKRKWKPKTDPFPAQVLALCKSPNEILELHYDTT